jgi:hypothetical protein
LFGIKGFSGLMIKFFRKILGHVGTFGEDYWIMTKAIGLKEFGINDYLL